MLKICLFFIQNKTTYVFAIYTGSKVSVNFYNNSWYPHEKTVPAVRQKTFQVFTVWKYGLKLSQKHSFVLTVRRTTSFCPSAVAMATVLQLENVAANVGGGGGAKNFRMILDENTTCRRNRKTAKECTKTPVGRQESPPPLWSSVRLYP
jgi:hypothetical protein